MSIATEPERGEAPPGAPQDEPASLRTNLIRVGVSVIVPIVILAGLWWAGTTLLDRDANRVVVVGAALLIGVLGVFGVYVGMDWLITKLPEKYQQRVRPFAFVGPAVTLLGLFLLYPTVNTFLLSFQGPRGGEWVGIDNYTAIFTNSGTLIAIRNSVLWVIIVPLFSVLIGLGFAVLTDRLGRKSEAVSKSFIFMPMAISFVGASIVWRFIYSFRPEGFGEQIGLLNGIMVGLGSDPVPWLLQEPWNNFFLMVILIWPLSFADSDGDGYGDLPGISARLEYLSDTLGVDAIWLSPFFKSPMRDWGYDVSDHTDVDPLFGDLDDAIALIEKAHGLGLRVVVDYVLNHVSDQHPWFQEAKASRDSPKRDWFVWRDGRDGGPPNNWVSIFGGPAWTFEEATGQWYRHTFLSTQPDLDWRNPEVVEAMMGVARFWLDLGVDGFRVDAAHHMMKDPRERDNPPAPPDRETPWKSMGEYDDWLHLYDGGHPDVHAAHRRFRSVVDAYERDALTIGEIHIFDLPEWSSYYGEELDEFSMPFNFHLMAADWDVPSVRAAVEAVLWSVPEGAWTNWTMGNHDEMRLASRLPEGHERIAATLILTLPGTPFLYYGDELGMRETALAGDASKDPWGLNVDGLSRDGARTPMQWSPEPNAGFTHPDAEPWLRIGSTYGEVNVETELADDKSLLNMYRRLLALRKESKALRVGSFQGDEASTDDVFVYRREHEGESLTIAANFSNTGKTVSVSAGSVVFSSHEPARGGDIVGAIDLAPREAAIVSHI